MTDIDIKFMQRCLDLAALGKGHTSPNPMVGSVIVFEDKIIGEGYHKKCGEAHAEVNAVNSVKNKELLSKSTLYVNLEPCAHVGRTPACSRLIIDLKIPRVVVGTTDNYEKVSGKGIKMLRNAGVDVKVGVLEKECLKLNRRFFISNKKKRPFIILKWAQTIDGFIDFKRSPETPVQPNWITDDFAKILVHKWRSEEDSIMIGTNTAEKDNPSLNVRDWEGKNPVRIVIDKNLRLNSNLAVFDNKSKTIVFSEKKRESFLNTEYIQIKFDRYFLKNIFEILFEKEIRSVIIEGGAILLNSLIAEGLWDEARVFVGEKLFFEGVEAPKIYKKPNFILNFDKNKLLTFMNYNL
jgi:diaminohydroxyphosphoribosylaminopyrimidine deaminase/5-amino-6-(5-phosphoribosylamino)uracil reductase